MTTQISVEVTFGAASDEDRDRAEAAALAVLAAAGTTPAAAHGEFMRQWLWLETDEAAEQGKYQDYEDMTGLAAVWVAAERAADVALTDGWADPTRGGCVIGLGL